MLFDRLPFLFGWSGTYRSWAEQRVGPQSSAAHGGAGRLAPYVPPAVTYVSRTTAAPLESKPVRVVCFYLPQFHSIPENDAWWGEGFTEWVKVRAAQPQFIGHYQPHQPGDLGYYDLRDTAVQRRQVELARLYGIEGFCFYVYWFGGKRLLETPVENYLRDESLDLPFCLCWANENWSRRWDGRHHEILIAQDHSPADDIAFISHYARYLRDPRYIRIGGRPLLVVYRPGLLPSARKTAKRWRKWCRENGIGEIYLAYTRSFDSGAPDRYGFDAAIEFPPNNAEYPKPPDRLVPVREDFGSTVYDWRSCVGRSEEYRDPGYRRFRAVCPGWDNTARRGDQGTVFLYNTPDLYRRWLENAARDTVSRFDDPDERLVFVNAWNEWAEGAYLEPNALHGYAYLQATRDALQAAAGAPHPRIVVVSHDAHPHGAQMLALSMARDFGGELGFDVDLIVLGEGELLERYREVATVHEIDLERDAEGHVLRRLRSLREKGAELAIVNTTVSGLLVPLLKSAGFQVVSLVHELPGLLRSYELQDHARAIAEHADRVVFAADKVREGFEEFVGGRLGRAVIRPQGLYLAGSRKDRTRTRERVRSDLGLASDAGIVLSVGYADHRKGLDLFVDACLLVLTADPRAFAVWAGNLEPRLFAAERRRIQAAGLEDRFVFPGFVAEPQDLYLAADVYALTSREDPFPSVVMEALDMETPVVAFAGATGCDALLTHDCGVLVPAFDTGRFAAALQELLADSARCRSLGAVGREIVRRELNFRHFLFDLLELGGRPLSRVSVIVPNYNYAPYLRERLASIERQTFPVFELIVLDDASTDASVETIEDFLAGSKIPSTLVVNEENSGSPFRQWRRGVEMARGDLIWIAEADDLAAPGFLAELVREFDRSEVVMSYCQSRQIDGAGGVLAETYLDYVADIDPERWKSAYVAEGCAEIATALFVKNTIPNVSAVLFRREALRRALTDHLEEITTFRNAGDWVTYLRILESGSIAFSPRSLSSHRRHRSSVTISGFDLRQLQEIVRVQSDTIARHGLGPEARERADAYAQTLYLQFGLATKARPYFADHPDIGVLREPEVEVGQAEGWRL
ncbi:MAG: glycoside hydrolase family 99-like domain-containing protein [Thermoanaerobaculia bacterium]